MTVANYERIQNGMTRSEVEAIFGVPGESNFAVDDSGIFAGWLLYAGEPGNLIVLAAFDDAGKVYHKQNIGGWHDRRPTLWERLLNSTLGL